MSGTALFAPWIAWHPANTVDLDSFDQGPSWNHPIGTDKGGRDLLARLLDAGRVSVSVGIAAALISAGIGTLLGLVSGYAGGWVDNVIQRFTEVVMTFPTLFVVLIMVSIIGPSVFNVIAVIGALGWTGKCRLVRGQVLSLREMEYVTAARAVGAGSRRLLFLHVLPGVLPYVALASTTTIGGAILTEASLSFLGLGVQSPQATWGNMMSGAQSLYVLQHQPWIWIPPGLAISLTVMSTFFIADGIRDALDPRTK
jgi:peptide/nickel transport system permease protein